MIGSTAKAEQFHTRSGSESTKGTRTGVNLLGWGEGETLTPQQQRDALIAAKIRLQAEAVELKGRMKLTLPFAQFQVLKNLRDEQKEKLTAIEVELAKLKPLLGNGPMPDLGEYLVKMYKASVTTHKWHCILADAKRQFFADHGYQSDDVA